MSEMNTAMYYKYNPLGLFLTVGQHCEQAICDVVYFSLWVSIVSRQYVMLSISHCGSALWAGNMWCCLFLTVGQHCEQAICDVVYCPVWMYFVWFKLYWCGRC